MKNTNLTFFFRPLKNVGIYSQNFQKKLIFEFHSQDVFPIASCAKLFVLTGIAKLYYDKDIDLAQKIIISKNDLVPGSGLIRIAKKKSYTINELCNLMIRVSDNTAFNKLINLINPKWLNKYLKSINLKHTYIGPLTFKTLEKNTSTPRDVGLLLSQIYLRKIRGASYILRTLEKNKSKKFIPLFLSSSQILHKTGVLDHGKYITLNDIGIVNTAKFDYSICILSNKRKNLELSGLQISIIAKLLHDHWRFTRSL